MRRRELLAALAAQPLVVPRLDRLAAAAAIPPSRGSFRVRPAVPDWGSPAEWDELCQRVGGRLIAVQSPFQPCREEMPAGSPVTPASITMISASRSHSTGSRSVCAFMEGPAEPNPSPSLPVAPRRREATP